MAASSPQQTKQNHVRIDPAFHYFLVPFLLVLSSWFLVHTVRHPGTEPLALFLLTVAVLVTAFKARTYALKVQSRVIRLEERLRVAAILPLEKQAECQMLTEGQLVALRFASDTELPGLAERAARENLSNKQIKDAIQTWRPDYWRV